MSYTLRFDGTQLFASFSPAITVNLGTTVTDWSFEFRLKIEAGALASSGFQYIFGSPTTTINGIYHRPGSGIGALAFAAGSAFRFASAAGFLLDDGEFHTYKIYRNIIADSSNLVRFVRDGVEFGSPVAWSTSVTMSLAVMSRASPTGTDYFGFELDYCTYQIPQSGVYTDWQADLANGTGTVLLTTDNSRDAAISGYSVNDNSWWISYGGASIALDSALQAFSSLTADLTAQIQLTTQFAGVSSITASLQTGAVTVANLGAVATITAALTTGIRLNSSMSNTSSISGVLSDAAPELPPQFIPVINSVTPYSNSAAVSYSYAGNDATSYKGRINGGAPFTLSVSPAIIVGLAPETTYALEIAAENSVGLGAWSAPTNFTTIAAGSSDELIIRNIVRPYLRPVLKEIKK